MDISDVSYDKRFFFLFKQTSMCTPLYGCALSDALAGSLCLFLVFQVITNLPVRLPVCVAVERGVSVSSLRLFIPSVLSAVAAGWQGAKGCREKFISRCYRLGGTTGVGTGVRGQSP